MKSAQPSLSRSPSALKVRAAHYRTGQVSEFHFKDGQLVSVCPSRGSPSLVYGPGLFEIQANGFAGVDFNHPGFTKEGFRLAVHALWRYGTTHVMPTIVTGAPERMAQGMRVVANAVRQFPEIRSCVAGIHQEGPYFANVEGARGAHPPECIIPPSLRHFDALQKAAGGLIRMLTLAPETKGAHRVIRALSRKGIVIAIGHTNATPAEIAAAVEAGARTSTHIGNGSAQMLPRHHNYMLAQLGDDRLYGSFIADGHHLPPFVLKSFLRAKPFEKCILTTDCMSAAGGPPGRYTIGWLVVEVGRDRVARQPGKPNFAGSAITMSEGIANAARFGGVSLAQAWDMSSLHPWRLMGRAAAVRQPSSSDTFIIARHEKKRFEIKATVIHQRLVYCA